MTFTKNKKLVYTCMGS